MREPRSLAHWLTGSLALLTLVGLGTVSIVVYLAAVLSLSSRQDQELSHRENLVRRMLAEVRTQDDLDLLRHKLDDYFASHTELTLTLEADNQAPIFAKVEAYPAHVRTTTFTLATPLVTERYAACTSGAGCWSRHQLPAPTCMDTAGQLPYWRRGRDGGLCPPDTACLPAST